MAILHFRENNRQSHAADTIKRGPKRENGALGLLDQAPLLQLKECMQWLLLPKFTDKRKPLSKTPANGSSASNGGRASGTRFAASPRSRSPSWRLIIDGCAVHEGHGRKWAQLPARPQLDPSGYLMRETNGKIKYARILSFADRETERLFSATISSALSRGSCDERAR